MIHIIPKDKRKVISLAWAAAVIANVALVQTSAMAEDDFLESMDASRSNWIFNATGTTIGLGASESVFGAQIDTIREYQQVQRNRLTAMKLEGAASGKIAAQERLMRRVGRLIDLKVDSRSFLRQMGAIGLLTAGGALYGIHNQEQAYISDRSIKKIAGQTPTVSAEDSSVGGAHAGAAK